MTPSQLKTLAHFRDGERFLNGMVIDWSTIEYQTMFWLEQLRLTLDAPIRLIRGAHPTQPTAVDACCPDRSMGEIFLGLTRLPPCSWGIYSGASFHLDTRAFGYQPARWLAVKDDEENLLKQFSLTDLETGRKDGWLYLAFNHPKSLDAVNLICRVADGKRLQPEET